MAQKQHTGGNGGWGPAPVAPKQQTGGNGGWGAPANLRSMEPSGWGVKKKSHKASRGTVWASAQARGAFIARVADAAERKRQAEMSYNQAVSDYDSADGRRDLANADLQAASAAWSSSTRDRQKAVEDSLDARVGLRLFDEEMRRLDKEERDE